MDDGVWRPFVAPACGLAVEFPGEPLERKMTLRTSGGPATMHGFEVELAGATYLATALRLPAGITISELVTLHDAPLDHWIVGGKRRRYFGHRPMTDQGLIGWTTEEYGLRPRADGIARVARKRRIEHHGHLYLALVILPAERAESPAADRFLRSLATVPIPPDRRGLNVAWRRRVARADDGFSILWPDRLDNPLLRVVLVPTGSIGALTYFSFEPPAGYVAAVADYYAPFPRPRTELRLDSATILADVRDRLLAETSAQLCGERPIGIDDLGGIEFEARFSRPTPADASTRFPPGPGVARLRARAYATTERAWLIYATTPEASEAHGAASFLDSFRPIERPAALDESDLPDWPPI